MLRIHAASQSVTVSGDGASAGVIKGRLEHEIFPGRAGPESLEGNRRGHIEYAGTGEVQTGARERRAVMAAQGWLLVAAHLVW